MKTRREVLLASAAAALGNLVGPLVRPAFAATVPMRSNVDTPEGQRNLAVLARAVSIMTGKDPAHPVSIEIKALGNNAARHRYSWARQEQIHAGMWSQHWTWRFFPWHRLQLAAFEAIVRELTATPDFALPYWDPRRNKSLPAAFFDTASPLYLEGRAATTELNFADALDHIRGLDPNYRFAYLSDPFDVFHGGPFVNNQAVPGTLDANMHGQVHNLIGGLMGDPHTATRDPVFWLHHANIDRIWWTWQQLGAGRQYPDAFAEEPIGEAFVHPSADVAAWRARDVVTVGERPNDDAAGGTVTLGGGMSYTYDKWYELPMAGAEGPSSAPIVRWRELKPQTKTVRLKRRRTGPLGSLFSLRLPAGFQPMRTPEREVTLNVSARIVATADTLRRAPLLQVVAIGGGQTVVWDLIAPFFHFDRHVKAEIKLHGLRKVQELFPVEGGGRIMLLLKPIDATGASLGGAVDAKITAELSMWGRERVE